MKKELNQLITYANVKGILKPRDNDYILNQLAYLLDVELTDSYKVEKYDGHIDLLLTTIANNYQKFTTPTELELFKAKIIGTVMERPSVVETKFQNLLQDNPKLATEFLYQYAKDVNYVKELQIKNNIVYQVPSKYGEIDITINLSKPEKSTKEIEMLKQFKEVAWPKCFLCKEQEGFYGTVKNPDRSNHRMINLKLNNQDWYFQYSPYSYFNEHSILLSSVHEDMKINQTTFSNLLNFVDQLPHYMVGSNADIPIVGGSMLTHDHYQCGNYEFPIFRADSKVVNHLKDVEIHAVNWPLHTVKLVGTNQDSILKASEQVRKLWFEYEDVENKIIKKTTKRHNTITPILRKQNNVYEMYLILRNNLTSEEHPSGIYHVSSKYHHVKQENIGLIEAIGLAVLPGRLKAELEELSQIVELPEHLIKHKNLFFEIEKYSGNNKLEYLYELVGKIFVKGLEDCGVFKYDETKYLKFLKEINE